MKKVSPFVKIKVIPPLLGCFLDLLTSKYSWPWSSMINLVIDSRTVKQILLSPRGKSNNYLELPRENVSGNMMLSH